MHGYIEMIECGCLHKHVIYRMVVAEVAIKGRAKCNQHSYKRGDINAFSFKISCQRRGLALLVPESYKKTNRLTNLFSDCLVRGEN